MVETIRTKAGIQAGKLTLINPDDRRYTRHRYVLWFGAYGDTRLMVWANHLEDALDESIDWIVDNAPGLLCDEQVTEAYNDFKRDNPDASEEEAYEEAITDTTIGGNCGHYILSYEWGIIAEDPSRADVLAILGDK